MDRNSHVYGHPDFKLNKGDIIRREDENKYYYVLAFDEAHKKKVIVKRLVKVPEFYADVGTYRFKWDNDGFYKVPLTLKYSRLFVTHVGKPKWFVLPDDWVTNIK